MDETTEFVESDRCHITRELTKDQILHKIIDSGGVFWHEPPPGISASLEPRFMHYQSFIEK